MAQRDDKGKGKAAEISKPSTSSPSDSVKTPSLISRITSSATTLTRDIVSTSPGPSLATALASTSSSSEKPRPDLLSHSNAANGESSTWAQNGLGNSRSGVRGIETGLESFRSANGDVGTEGGEEDFRVQAEAFGLSTRPSQQVPNDDEALEMRPSRPARATVNGNGNANHWTQAEQSDGQDVAALLSDRQIGAGETFEDALPGMAPDSSAEELFNTITPTDEQRHTRQLIDQIFAPPSHVHPTTGSFTAIDAPVPSYFQISQNLPDDIRDDWSWFLDIVPGRSRRYADEVWSPPSEGVRMVTESLREVTERREGEERERAVRRLGAVLRHLREGSVKEE